MNLKNKRGSEFVEAAIVMPLLILLVISIMCAAAYAYDALAQQVEAQREALVQADESSAVYSNKESERNYGLFIQGAYNRMLSGTYRCWAVSIDGEMILRAGGLIDE